VGVGEELAGKAAVGPLDQGKAQRQAANGRQAAPGPGAANSKSASTFFRQAALRSGA